MERKIKKELNKIIKGYKIPDSKNKNKDFILSKELGLYIMKKELGSSHNGYKSTTLELVNDHVEIKISLKELVSYIKLLFSNKYNIFTEKELFRKELNLSKNQLLEITTNFNKHIEKHNLGIYVEYLRKNTNNKKIVLTMKGKYETLV